MRNLFILLGCIFFSLSCKPDKNAFVIEGKINGLDVPHVYLIHPEESGEQIDTLEVKNGAFRIKGSIENPNVYLLAFGEEFMPLEIFLEPGKFEVKGDLKDFNSLQVTGGPIQFDYNEFVKIIEPYNDAYTQEYDAFTAAKKANDLPLLEEISYRLDSIKDIYYAKSYDFVESKPVNILTAKLIGEILIAQPDLDRLNPLVAQFNDHLKKTSFGQRIINTLTTMSKTSVGTEAPLFTMNDVEGNAVSLENYKGKYVLVDFWASWCGPCRDENPRIVQVFKKYKGSKFDILGVSIDQNSNQWKKAIEEDQLLWTQVLDDQNIANQSYGVISIPANVLVSPEGVIVGKNLFGKKLEDQLTELLK